MKFKPMISKATATKKETDVTNDPTFQDGTMQQSDIEQGLSFTSGSPLSVGVENVTIHAITRMTGTSQRTGNPYAMYFAQGIRESNNRQVKFTVPVQDTNDIIIGQSNAFDTYQGVINGRKQNVSRLATDQQKAAEVQSSDLDQWEKLKQDYPDSEALIIKAKAKGEKSAQEIRATLEALG